MTKRNIKTVSYSFVVAELFHYGHLQLLKAAKAAGDYHICGVLSDEATTTYRNQPITNFDERCSVISSINCVDRVIKQSQKDPIANLKAIHAEFPDAKLVLVHGNDWRDIPGRAYIESIGGEVLQPEYYKRLAEGRIKEEIFSTEFQDSELFTEHFKVDGITFFHREVPRRLMSTKANTLKHLSPLLKRSRIEKSFVFRVGDWRKKQATVLSRIQSEFVGKVVIRSSAINEDTETESMAGYYESILDIPVQDQIRLRNAVEGVINSYEKKGWANEYHQVLVQKQTPKVVLSGVVFTYKPDSCAPYYIINYDNSSGRTDTVTSGISSKMVTVARNYIISKCPEPWGKVLSSIREIESLIPNLALDIEFGIDGNGDFVIYQVRPLVIANRVMQKAGENNANSHCNLKILTDKFKKLSKPIDGEAGTRTAFSDMAFWNPAEIIGNRSNLLSYSLYRYLITDEAWNTGLLPLGYTEIAQKTLMIEFAGKAYIDLRKVFNVLLPAEINESLRKRIVNGCLDRLQAQPELHDKIEFEVLDSSFLFDLRERKELYSSYGLTDAEFVTFTDALSRLTARVIGQYKSIVETDFGLVAASSDHRNDILQYVRKNDLDGRRLMRFAIDLLEQCLASETAVFSRQARMAFIGNALLLSMRRKGYISEEDYAAYLRSLKTVASEFYRDHHMFLSGMIPKKDFMSKYGHLRPNTYNITSLRYDHIIDKLTDGSEFLASEVSGSENFTLNSILRNRSDMEQRLAQNGLDVSMSELFEFIKISLESRERVKFEFTKNISDALELFATAGEQMNLSRELLAQVKIGELRHAANQPNDTQATDYLKRRIEYNKQRFLEQQDLVLPSIIFSERDFYFIKEIHAKPNFITNDCVDGALQLLTPQHVDSGGNLAGKIILIESADPGYDWIFTRNIKGLITRFGGLASHMAIRCAEFGLPAAIGCGDAYYRALKKARHARLDCAAEEIIVLNINTLQ